MSTLENQYNEVIANYRETKKKMQDDMKVLFKKVFKEFFEKNPGINAVVWLQYTPYFNDGDPCVFGVRGPSFTNASDPENVKYGEYDGNDESEDVWATESSIKYVLDDSKKYYQETRDAILRGEPVDVDSCEFISKMINSSEMEDILHEMFGDHVQVVATRNGFDVNDHDHD